MKRKFKLIVPSFLTLIFCLLLIAGSTFAIFTSQDQASIAVTSGKVDLKAVLTDMHAYSVEATDEEGDAGSAEAFGVTSNYKYVAREQVNDAYHYGFATGGTAALESNALTLNKIVPGDRVTINLRLENYSNVITKYRLKVTAQEAADNTGLLEGLEINITKGSTTKQLKGVIRVDAWEELPAVTGDDPDVINVGIEVVLPVSAGNQYQDKKAKLRFTVEAVQGNAKIDETLDHVNAHLTQLGNTNKTMHDAVLDAADYIANHSPETFDATKYLWNIDTDQFYDPSNVVAGFEDRYFKAYNQSEFNNLTSQTYNIYATGEWSSISPSNPVAIVVGFDAGDATGITDISYVRTGENDKAQEVVIRTNDANTNLVINAPKDVVHHYDIAGTLTIIAVANSSYHENGVVAFIEISTGRIALEETSSVKQIHLSTTYDEEIHEDVFNNITVAKAEDAPMPDFSRDPVEIPEEGKLVVALQSSTEEEAEKDYVWLTAVGIYEQVTVSDSDKEAGEVYATEMTAQTQAEQQKVADQKQAAQQIANNISATIGTEEYSVHAEKNEQGDWEYKLQNSQNQTTEHVVESVVVVTNKVEEVVTSVATVTVAATTVKETTINNNTNNTETAKQTAMEAVYTNVPYLAPTCTQSGHTAYVTWIENNIEKSRGYEEIPATGHTPAVSPAVEPTCTETGLTEGSHCSVCNAILVAQQEIPALGHTPVVDTAVAPTCTETGLTEGSHCSVCNAVLTAQQEVAALGHNLDENRVCKVCGEEFPCEHNYEVIKNYWKIENEQYEFYEKSKCTLCGDEVIHHHDLAGMYCNTCKHMIPFVLDTLDFANNRITDEDLLAASEQIMSMSTQFVGSLGNAMPPLGHDNISFSDLSYLACFNDGSLIGLIGYDNEYIDNGDGTYTKVSENGEYSSNEIANQFEAYTVDFSLEFNVDIDLRCMMLVGTYNGMAVGIDAAFEEEEDNKFAAGTELPVMGSVNWPISYGFLREVSFICGLYIDADLMLEYMPDIVEQFEDATVTVRLFMYQDSIEDRVVVNTLIVPLSEITSLPSVNND